jgi:hypothetical protein
MANSRPWSRRTAYNQVDGLFRPQLLMNIRDTPKLMSAQFDFVVEA